MLNLFLALIAMSLLQLFCMEFFIVFYGFEVLRHVTVSWTQSQLLFMCW